MTDTSEILCLQYSNQMVLVSSPEKASHGVNGQLGVRGMVQGQQESGPLVCWPAGIYCLYLRRDRDGGQIQLAANLCAQRYAVVALDCPVK